MNNKATLFSGMLLVVAIALSSTGCMTSHSNGQFVGDKDKTQTFNGWTSDPDQEVHLYAMKSFGNWVYLGQAKVGTSAHNEFGVNWYFWYLQEEIPSSCWHYYGPNQGPGDYMAIIKAEDEYGNPLYYWEEGFYTYYQDYDSLQELWEERGDSSGAVVIWGD